jgi:D-sedoheptulose 7-phosphate isomerase
VALVEKAGLVERRRGAHTPQQYARAYLDYLGSILERIDTNAVAAIIEELEAARLRGSTIFTLGNGGSAATASHLVNDLLIGVAKAGGTPFRAVALTDNVAVMTAVANDIDYTRVFVDQLRGLLQADDVVVAFSASGNSPNVIEAVRFARQHQARTIACCGFGGGLLRGEADHCLEVPSYPGEYGPVEDVMLVLGHIVASHFIFRAAGE